MAENQTQGSETDTGADNGATIDENDALKGEFIPRSEVDGLLKALRAERESRKTYEKEAREKAAQLEKFAQINPDEYRRLQEEAAIAERERLAAEERTSLLEEKYGAQAAQAVKKAEQAQAELQTYRKRYALEKVFLATGGRTDAVDGVSFFDLLANRIEGDFRLEANGTVTVIDANGDPVLDAETGKRVDPETHLSKYKEHPVYGTFFKGAKGSGAGLGLGGTDARGVSVEDFTALSTDEMFERAFQEV